MGSDNRPEGAAPPKPCGPPLGDLQRGFAAHIRDPRENPAPADVEDRRMAIYRRLFFNNVSTLLAGNFPVLRSLLSDDAWQAMVRDFYANYRCQTPLFPEIAREFLRYLQDNRGMRSEDPPFLLELAHYEWVELALELDEREIDGLPANRNGDLLAGRPLLSPLAWPLSYHFPVQRIGPDWRPQEPPQEATHLLVYRNRSDEVKFMLLNPVTRLLLQQLGEHADWSGEQHLRAVAAAIAHPEPERVIRAGEHVFADLRDRDVVLGTRAD